VENLIEITTRVRTRARELAAASRRRTLTKVPDITPYFWIIKLLTTAMGETTADYLDHWLPPVVAGTLAGLGLIVALVLQFSVRRYVAWLYWIAVVMVAIFGTMAADGLHVELGIPYLVTASLYAAVLVVIFVSWHVSEKTLSIHSIYTAHREAFYWAAVLATFALGTAVGDLTARTFGLGYLASAVLFAILIVLPGLAYRWLRLNVIVAFWLAYVLTRPLGASVADWMGVAHNLGGLGLGRGAVSVIMTIPIFALVAYLAVTRLDVTPGDQAPSLRQ
jgi:uncharacterized membrane-anchored protein